MGAVASSALITSELDAPCHDVNGSNKPNQASRPSVETCELVKVDLDEEGDSEDGKRRRLECKENDEGEKRECDDSRSATDRPPGLWNGVFR